MRRVARLGPAPLVLPQPGEARRGAQLVAAAALAARCAHGPCERRLRRIGVRCSEALQQFALQPSELGFGRRLTGVGGPGQRLVEERKSLLRAPVERQTLGDQPEVKGLMESRARRRIRGEAGPHPNDAVGRASLSSANPAQKYFAPSGPEGKAVFGGDLRHFFREPLDLRRVSGKDGRHCRVP